MSKYNNTKIVYNGRKYDSRHEAEVAMVLQKSKDIEKIEYQFPIVICPSIPKVQRAITYLADFRVTLKDGTVRYFDAKGFRTEVFKLKKKLVRYLHNIVIEEL